MFTLLRIILELQQFFLKSIIRSINNQLINKQIIKSNLSLKKKQKKDLLDQNQVFYSHHSIDLFHFPMNEYSDSFLMDQNNQIMFNDNIIIYL